MAETITACVIARDEQERLPGCLASLAFCDEIVVVDSGSRDRTMEIARAAGATVVEHPWRGFATQRNVAIDHATSDWVLEVDADERITPELAAELRAFLDGPPPAEVNLGLLPMRHVFLGRLLGPSGHYPFSRARLLRRGAYRHDEARTVHEGLWPRERPAVFVADMHHLLAGGLREALADTWAYAALEARQLGAVSAREAVVGVVARPPLKFAYNVVVLGGWRDGWRGLLKVGLECLGDAVVWVRAVAGRGGPSAEGTTDDAAGGWAPDAAGIVGGNRGHFGHRFMRQGPVRLVAVASGERAANEARAWLTEAAATGAWSVLVTNAASAEGDGDVQRIARVSPGLVARALDWQSQLSPADAVVPFGGRARAALRMLPSTARLGTPVVAPPPSASATVATLRAERS